MGGGRRGGEGVSGSISTKFVQDVNRSKRKYESVQRFGDWVGYQSSKTKEAWLPRMPVHGSHHRTAQAVARRLKGGATHS